jgi:hypothetical protein
MGPSGSVGYRTKVFMKAVECKAREERSRKKDGNIN